MNNLARLLSELTRIEGISSAVVIGRDGFVIDGVVNGTDPEALGATITTGFGSAEVMGRELKIGDISQGMMEYRDGIVVISQLGAQAVLAVVADHNAAIGNVRYQIKKRSAEIERAL